ncbi:hypothetical protein F4861DRAFT_24417 [Xylaria intraflava]|nr:hypothetical protein F4861DRAFT_24417 [Xylaria intraflava]
MVIAVANLPASNAMQPTSVFAPGTGPVGAGMGTESETGSGTEPGPAPESAPAAALPVVKPTRRFAPQLIERTTKISSDGGRRLVSFSNNDSHANTKSDAGDVGTENNLTRSEVGHSALMTPSTISNATQPTGDSNTSLQFEDSGVSTSQPSTRNIRRFAPIPIETTFDSYRVANKNPHEPAPEPTPDPSPTTSQSLVAFPPTTIPGASGITQATVQKKNPKRRFAPQLIETTRKSKRAGQEGPLMKPTDKTDITPNTNHIYASRPKSKHGAPRLDKRSAGPANARAEDETTSPRFTPRRDFHPKARANRGRSMRHNSYHPDLDTIVSSESGNSSEDDSEAVPALNLGAAALYNTQSNLAGTWSTRGYDLRNRRESCDEEFSGYLLGIAAREALRQRELEQALSAFPNGMPPQGVEHFFARDNSEDDLQIGDDESPLRHGPSQLLRRKSTDPGWAVKEMRAHAEKLARMRVEAHTSADHNPAAPESTPPPDNPLWSATTAHRKSRDPAIRNSTDSFSTHSPVLSARLPPGYDKLFTPPPSTGVRTSPFGMGFAFRTSEPEDDALGKMRKAASPPMLGADLTFRTCPSPQYTRMEPNHPYSHSDRLDERQRDRSDTTGLWRGYCSSKASKLESASLQPPGLLRTPSVYSAIDPFASAFGASTNKSDALSPAYASGAVQTNLPVQNLFELDERLEKERESQIFEETLLAEFDDLFITQVYNYLSLGYPATARAFDDELSKISGICLEELRKDDNVEIGKGFMRHMEISLSCGSMDSGSSDDSSGDEQIAVSPIEYGRRPRYKTPRWTALKLYIHEWARQHPSLNDDGDSGPPAWGVRARRGSWAI